MHRGQKQRSKTPRKRTPAPAGGRRAGQRGPRPSPRTGRHHCSESGHPTREGSCCAPRDGHLTGNTLLLMRLGGCSGERSIQQTGKRAVPSPTWTGHPIHRDPKGTKRRREGVHPVLPLSLWLSPLPPVPLPAPPAPGAGMPPFLAPGHRRS